MLVSWILPPVNAGFVGGAALGTAVALTRHEGPWFSLVLVVATAWAAGSLYRTLQ